MLRRFVFYAMVNIILVLGMPSYSQEWKSYAPKANMEIKRFVLGDNIVDAGKDTMAPVKCRIYSSDRGVIRVSEDKDILHSVIYTLPKMDVSTQDVGLEGAKKATTDWMHGINIEIADWTLLFEKKHDTGSAGIKYRFFWTRFTQDGVRLPCYISATVRSDGYLESWSCIDEPVTISTKPRVSRNELSAIVTENGIKVPAEDIQPMLRIWNIRGKQRLLWELWADKDYSRPSLALIDANSAEIIAGASTGNIKPESSKIRTDYTELLRMLRKTEEVEVRSGDPMRYRKLNKQSAQGKRLANFVIAVIKSNASSGNKQRFKDLLLNGATFHITGGYIVAFDFSHKHGTVRIHSLKREAGRLQPMPSVPIYILDPAPDWLKKKIIAELAAAEKEARNVTKPIAGTKQTKDNGRELGVGKKKTSSVKKSTTIKPK